MFYKHRHTKRQKSYNDVLVGGPSIHVIVFLSSKYFPLTLYNYIRTTTAYAHSISPAAAEQKSNNVSKCHQDHYYWFPFFPFFLKCSMIRLSESGKQLLLLHTHVF